MVGFFFADDQAISMIILSAIDPIAKDLCVALRHLLLPWHIVVPLDKT